MIRCRANGSDRDSSPFTSTSTKPEESALAGRPGFFAPRVRGSVSTLPGMTSRFDDDWMAVVCGRLDRVFEEANAGFVRSAPQGAPGGPVDSLLWEADAESFLARYPDSGIREAYGDQWPPPCIDHWVYVSPTSTQADLSLEGCDPEFTSLPITGNADEDSDRIAHAIAKALDI